MRARFDQARAAERDLSDLFEAPVALRIATQSMCDAGLSPAEGRHVARAIPSRVREFTGGRAAARAALAQLGGPAGDIERDANRAPVWPHGFVGSITHCDDFCCAVAARASDLAAIGIDAEPLSPLPAELVRYVCTAAEEARLKALPAVTALHWAKLVFCAKEAFYKCHYQIARTFLEFRDVEIHIEAPSRRARAGTFVVDQIAPDKPLSRSPSLFRGRWMIDAMRIYAGAAAPAHASSAWRKT